MCGILFTISPTAGAPAPSPSLSALISRRGPDSTRTHSATFGSYTLTFTSSVLSLRGTHITPQPLVDPATGSVLCWNGEAWRIGEDALVPGVNDGEEVFKLLLAAGAGRGLKEALEVIRGPYALVYFDAVAGRVWFGRDALGRRSLLCRESGKGWEKGFMVASVGDERAGWSEVEADGLRWLDLVTGGQAGWVPFMWDEDAEVEGKRDFMVGSEMSWCGFVLTRLQRMPFPKLSMALADPSGPPTPESPGVAELQQVLLDSINTRVRDIPGRDNERVRLAIMFSGGLDCTMIARLVHECLPLVEEVDLLNVAFENKRVIEARNVTAKEEKKKKEKPWKKPKGRRSENKIEVDKQKLVITEEKQEVSGETNTYELCPDRITGRQSLAELRRVCPGREWHFVAIDIPYEELLEHRQTVVGLIHPHNTEMDLSIAVAFYFASRGTGLMSTTSSDPVLYTTPARILFSGLGADELLGGYARHTTAYRFRGTAGLLSELQLDVGRLGKRNLGRDDRVLAHWGREARYPFLEEKVVEWCMRAGWEGKRDKAVLRCLARKMGMSGVAVEPKRAVQFGSRSARMEGGEKGKVKGTMVLGDTRARN